jgi:hypothetical protein
MKHDDALAYLRQPGKTDAQVVEILAALASGFSPRESLVSALDACIERIECDSELSARQAADAADFYAEIERNRRIGNTLPGVNHEYV